MSWTAIWDNTGQVRGPNRADHPAFAPGTQYATLILEGRLARAGDRPVRLWAGAAAAEARFSLYRMPDGALAIYHRDLTLVTEPDMLAPGETFLVHYRTDRAGRAAIADIQNVDRGLRLLLRPAMPTVPALADILPQTDRYLEQMTLAAIASHTVPIGPVPCFETGTPIETPAGPVRVEDLRVGMLVNTVDRGPQTVRWTGRREVLGLGSMAPVLLRAPYFGLSQDIRVSPQHRMLLDGPDVEYLFGEERVYVRAGDLVNGVSVKRDQTKATRIFHHFLLDDHDCVQIGRCRMETLLLGDLLAAEGQAAGQLQDTDATPRYPTLDRAAAQSLLSLIAEYRRIAA